MTGNTVYVLLKGEVDTLHQELDDAIVGVFTPGGSLEFSELPTLSADVLGMVYTVTDDFTTDSRFKEGAGKDYPAGTNVAVVNVGTVETPVYKFDAKTSVIAVDDELSITSENPVQNKVITAALNAIELPDEITTSEAHDDFEAVFGSGTTPSNLISLTPEVFDSETVVNTIYEGTPTDKSTYITGDTYDFDYSNYERLKITGCNYNKAQGVDGRWNLPGDIAVIDNPQEGDTFVIYSDGGRYEQGTYVFTATGVRRTNNRYGQCGIFSIVAVHPNISVDSI